MFKKWAGPIGFGVDTETAPGVWDKMITERKYRGDIIRNTRQLQEGEKVNSDISVGVSISIIANAYANEHFFDMLYIKWMGVFWTVSNVEVDLERPRLILRLGGVYNGQKAPTPSDIA